MVGLSSNQTLLNEVTLWTLELEEVLHVVAEEVRPRPGPILSVTPHKQMHAKD